MNTYEKYKDAFKYAPGSATVQQMIGKTIDKTFDDAKQRRKESEEREANRRKTEILNYQFAQQRAKNMEDLYIVGDTASKDFNEVLVSGSRQLADYAGYLNKELKRTGDYDVYASEMAKLKSQVSQMKTVKGGINDFLQAYQTGKIDNSISSYNSENLIAMAEDMLGGSPNGGWQNINGQQVWVGQTVATGDIKPKEYMISASEFSNLTKRLQKKEDIGGLLKDAVKINTTSAGNILGFDQAPSGKDGTLGVSASEAAEFAIENLMKGFGGDPSKVASILVDNYGITREEADELSNTIIEDEKGIGIGNKAEQRLKELALEEARNMYSINQSAVEENERKERESELKYADSQQRRREFQRNQRETETFLSSEEPAIWNQNTNKFKDKNGNINNFGGLVGQWAQDLNKLGLEPVIETTKGESLSMSTMLQLINDGGEEALMQALDSEGQEVPKGIFIKNPANPQKRSLFIDFTASPLDIQNTIRAANNLPSIKQLSQGAIKADNIIETDLDITTPAGLPVLQITN
jgi:hypothetical protein